MAGELLKFKRSDTLGSVPSSLEEGELAINTEDGVIYTADPSGTVVPIGNVARWGRIDGTLTDQTDLMAHLTKEYGFFYNGSGNTQTLTSSTYTPIVWPNGSWDANYSLNSTNDIISISTPGTYLINYKVSFTTSNNTRKVAVSRLKMTIGGTWTDLDYTHTYHRRTNAGSNSASGQYLITITKPEDLLVETQTTTSDVDTADYGCSLLIEKVKDASY
jgi:hypothetical protein